MDMQGLALLLAIGLGLGILCAVLTYAFYWKANREREGVAAFENPVSDYALRPTAGPESSANTSRCEKKPMSSEQSGVLDSMAEIVDSLAKYRAWALHYRTHSTKRGIWKATGMGICSLRKCSRRVKPSWKRLKSQRSVRWMMPTQLSRLATAPR